jgi:hypothetical protein
MSRKWCGTDLSLHVRRCARRAGLAFGCPESNGNEDQDQDQTSKKGQITDLTGLIGVGGAVIAELDDEVISVSLTKE